MQSVHIVFARSAHALRRACHQEPPTQWYYAIHTETGVLRMPYYTFDLVLGEEFKNQGTIILENLDVASERADQLAIELSQVRPELKARGCAVRVADVDNRELYRTPLDPVPGWMRRRHSAA
jgi:hypothetical protein